MKTSCYKTCIYCSVQGSTSDKCFLQIIYNELHNIENTKQRDKVAHLMVSSIILISLYTVSVSLSIQNNITKNNLKVTLLKELTTHDLLSDHLQDCGVLFPLYTVKNSC